MFYQNNNDYMRDAFYYSTPQNSTYQNGWGCGFTPINNAPTNMLQNGQMPGMQRTPVSNMYPQVYRIINPVANRVISSSNYPFVTEDTLNNMVDTVYNIVEGDISTLTSTNPINTGDDTISQGTTRGNQTTTLSTTNNSNGNARQTTVTENTRTASTTVSSQNNRNTGENQLLRDLIKIIIIKELLSRQMNGFGMEGVMGNQISAGTNNFFDPRMYGMM